MQHVRDHWFQLDAAGGCEADRVLEVGLRADVREEVAKTAFAKEVDIDLEGAPEPRDADDLPTGADCVDRSAR